MLLLSVAAAAGETGLYDKNTAYILNPPTVPDAPKTKHKFVNILMLGVDFGIRTSGKGKKKIENCHTDTVIMAAVDLTDNKISLISIPRDTLTYVPGVYGVYKLNAAINCAASFEEGIQTVRNTVSRLLGGIRPDYYMVVTPRLVEEIGDRIGGLDIDVEMNYKGHSGTSYKKGQQHLNGVGIMDYARARRNASKNNNDLGRISRQQTVLNALYKKIKRNPAMVYDILDVMVKNFDENIFTDMPQADMLKLLARTEKLAANGISTYVMSGELTMAMKYFTANFLDQKQREDILRKIYGITAPKLRLNSHGYLNYLFKYGFAAVKTIRVSTRVIDWAKDKGYSGTALTDAVKARKSLIDQLSKVDDTLKYQTTVLVEKRTSVLQQAVTGLKKACKYPEKLDWSIVKNDRWNLDPDINQYNNIDWN